MQEELDASIVDSVDIKDDTEVDATKFYAVSFPDASSSLFDAHPLVLTSKNEALEAIKKYSGSRFKQFSSYEDAVEYASKPLPSAEVQGSLAEEKSLFKSPISQEMVALRKTIETGNEISFLDKVWSNPRYLINSNGDHPTVMQEGTRYNALHVAAKFKETNMCLTILNTLHDVEFVSRLYPNKSSPKIREHIKRLVDLYLNTPDKSLSETPLHFACKYGAEGILSILLSFPECDINRHNKYGILAREMICDRVSGNLGLKERMLLMFEDLFYVPVCRDIANNIQEPVIGKPCRSNIVLEATAFSLSSGFVHRKNLVYCAFAGPMSQSAADKFYTVFSKKKFTEQLLFTPEQKKQLLDICLSDSEKGLERVGRKLAKEFGIGWIEFWPKLKFWGDLSSEEGLKFLNDHLKNQYKRETLSFSSLDLEPDNFSDLIINFVDEFVKRLPDLLHNKNKMTFFILFQGLLPYTFCMSEFSFSEEKERFLIHHEIGELLYLKLIEISREHFEAIKFYINTQLLNIYNFLSCGTEKWKMFLCILKYLCYCQSSNISALKPPVCHCDWIIQRDCYHYNSLSCYYSTVKLKQDFASRLACTTHSLKNERYLSTTTEGVSCGQFEGTASCNSTVIKEKEDSTLEDHFLICAMQSLTLSSDEEKEEDEEFITPPESPLYDIKDIFLHGNDFSEVDIDVLRAVVDGGITISEVKHPYVFSWKSLIESKLGSLLNPEDKLSCTPASSSASVRRAVMPKEKVRRTLF